MVCLANQNELITTRQQLEEVVQKEVARTVMAYRAQQMIGKQINSVGPSINRVLEAASRLAVASNER